MRAREALAAPAALAALCALPFLPLWAGGLTLFWGDLSYLHHPWRALDAQILEGGRLPTWDPYVYLGMPLSATMQDSLFYPASLPFYLFGFATALSFFELFHLWLAGTLTLLWLRSLRAPAAAALAGAVLYSLGGLLLAHRVFLNHLAVLSLLPGVLLLARKPAWLALALACAFFAGYPPFWLGLAACALVFPPLLGAPPGETVRRFAAAAALGLALSAVLLIPAAELVLHSRRAGGVGLEEALTFGLSPSDLVQWISPVLVPWARFDPSVDWWKCEFLGFSGALAVGAGLRRRGRRSLGLAAWAAAVVWLSLGSSTRAGLWAWSSLPPLRFIRYPGNVAYLAWPALVVLVAAGLSSAGKRARRLWLAALAAELSLYGFKALPAAPRTLFTQKGQLTALLQAELGGRRYLLSPRALETHAGAGVTDWKERLYGLTNAPYRIRSTANFGEPLVPALSYRFMDALYSAPGAAQAAAWFSAADVLYLMTPKPLAPTPLLKPAGQALWSVSRLAQPPSPAYWLDSASGAELPEGLGVLPARVRPLLCPAQEREDRFDVEAQAGDAPRVGWAFVSQPRYPGWDVYLETPLGTGLAPSSPALLAFQKIPVPAGPWTLHFLYDPASWRWALWLGALAWVAAAALAFRRAAAVIR